MSDWIGRTIAKVDIHQLLGRGGMAEVYLGTHATLGRPVAVKVLLSHLSDDPELLARFESEARAVAALRHPNIVQIFDFDVFDDRPYMVMEYIAGHSLAEHMRRLRATGRTLTPETSVRLIDALAAALDEAHAHGIVHRDIKPANILLRRDSGPLPTRGALPPDVVPVLTDFGVMRMVRAGRQTAAGQVYGTPAYMSPEQARGEDVDSRSDIYSLGIVLYEMLTGHPPFDGENESPGSLLVKHITEPPPPAPGVLPGVQVVLNRALDKSRETRYQTAGEMALELAEALSDPHTVHITTPARAGLPRPRWSSPALANGPAAVGYAHQIELLRQGEIFAGLDDAALAKVAGSLLEQRAPAGTILFHRGDPGEMLYLVLGGRIKIFTRDASGVEQVLAYMGEGSVFGEMALLTDEPRSASAEAVEDCRLLLLTGGDFDRLLTDNPAIQRALLRVLALRQATMNARLLEATGGHAPRPNGRGEVLAVYGAKGGVGTSTVAVNVAAALVANRPGQVALLDLSLPFCRAGRLLNLQPLSSLTAIPLDTLLGTDPDLLNDHLTVHGCGLRLLPAVTRLVERERVTRGHVEGLIALCRKRFQYTVIDLGDTLPDPIVAAITAADRLVLVTTPDRAALQDARECRRFFGDVLGVAPGRFTYVLNQPAPYHGLAPGEFASALERAPDVVIPYAAEALPLAARRGEPLVLTHPDDPAAVALAHLATALADAGRDRPAVLRPAG